MSLVGVKPVRLWDFSILLGLLSGAAFAAGPPLDKLGRSLVLTNCEIVWNAPTNGWPASVSLYRVRPTRFSEEVLSKLQGLGPFTGGGRELRAPDTRNDPKAICYASGDRTLGIFPRFGFVEYRFPSRAGIKPEEVPSEEEARRLGTNYLQLLGLEMSEISPNVVVTSEMGNVYEGNPSRPIPTRFGCTVEFVRCLYGLEFFNKTEGCRLEFGNHSALRALDLSWRRVRSDEKYQTPDSNGIMRWMRQGKCFWAASAPPTTDSTVFRKITVKKATAYYWGEPKDEPQDLVYPFVLLETVIKAAVPGATIQTDLSASISCSLVEQ